MFVLKVKNSADCWVESPNLKEQKRRQKAFMYDFSYWVHSVLNHFQSKLHSCRVNECRTLTEIKTQGINIELWNKRDSFWSWLFHQFIIYQLAPKCNRSCMHICALISAVAIAAGIFAYYIFRSWSYICASFYTCSCSDFSGTIITCMSNDKCIGLYLHGCIYMDLYIHGSEITVSLGKFLCLAQFYSTCSSKFWALSFHVFSNSRAPPMHMGWFGCLFLYKRLQHFCISQEKKTQTTKHLTSGIQPMF